MFADFILGDNHLITSLLVISVTSLIVPILNLNNRLRNILLALISIIFFLNVLLVDYTIFQSVTSTLNIFIFDIYKFEFHIEPLGCIFLTMLSFLWIWAIIYTCNFLEVNDVQNQNKFIFFINSAIFIGILVALSANLITMFVLYELLTLATIPLIAHDINEYVIKGLKSYLAVLMISSIALFLPAIIYIYYIFGHGDFTSNIGFVKDVLGYKEVSILLVMFLFGISKTAIYPLHKWLPAAMVASYPVSALLHAVVVVKTGLFCFYKIMVYVFGIDYLHSLFGKFNWFIIFPIVTILYSSYKSLFYDKIKTILAYSTINQLSISMIAALMFTPKAFAAAILHMLTHSCTKISIFYAAGNFYSVARVNKISDLASIYKLMPITAVIIFIAGLSILGIPPFAGFVSKFYIMLAAAQENNLLVMLIIVISSFFSAIYVSKFLIFIYKPVLQKGYNNSRDLRDITKKSNNRKIPNSMLLSLVICCITSVMFIFIQPLVIKILSLM